LIAFFSVKYAFEFDFFEERGLRFKFVLFKVSDLDVARFLTAAARFLDLTFLVALTAANSIASIANQCGDSRDIFTLDANHALERQTFFVTYKLLLKANPEMLLHKLLVILL
jgi:hypothetical protein